MGCQKILLALNSYLPTWALYLLSSTFSVTLPASRNCSKLGTAPESESRIRASLYEAFEPAEARHLAERLDIHYTSKHDSWLNREGRDRDQCNGRPMPEPSPARPRSPTPGSRCLAGAEEPRSRAGGLAIHDRRRADQTETPLPINTKVMTY